MGTRNSSGAHNGSAHAAAACRGAQTTVCLIVGAPISLEWPILHIIGGKEARWTGSNSRRPFAGYSSPENKAQSLRAPRFSRQIWPHLDSHQLCLGAPRSHQRTWVDKDGAKPHQSSDILSPNQNLGAPYLARFWRDVGFHRSIPEDLPRQVIFINATTLHRKSGGA
jgi:hypothetical protein